MTALIRITAAMVFCSGVLAAQAPPPVGDNQRRLRESITPEDITALSRSLSFSQELRQLVSELQRDPQKLPPSLKKIADNPERILSLIKQVPPELMSKVQEKQVQELKAELQQNKPDSKRPPSMNEPPPSSRTNLSGRPTSRTMAALDPRLQNNPTVRNMLRLWERNFGSLEKTPALKQAFADLLNSSMQNEGTGGGLFESEELNSLFNPDTPIGKELAEWLDAAANGTPWKLSDLGLNNLSLRLPEASLPSAGIGYSPPSFAASSDGPSLMTLLLFGGAIAIGIALLRQGGWIWPKNNIQASTPPIELVDPNSVVNRASLVKAFESIAMRVLGRDAEAWTHTAIAAEFAQRNLNAQEVAQLYELARYSPPGESISDAAFADARRCLSLLDGAAKR